MAGHGLAWPRVGGRWLPLNPGSQTLRRSDGAADWPARHWLRPGCQGQHLSRLFFRWYKHEHRHSGIGYHARRRPLRIRQRDPGRQGPPFLDSAHAPIQSSSPASTQPPPARSGLDQQTGRPIEPDPVLTYQAASTRLTGSGWTSARAGPRRSFTAELGSVTAAASPCSRAPLPRVARTRTGMRRRIPVPHRAGNLRPGHQQRAGYAGSVQDMAQPGDVSRQGVSCRGGRPVRHGRPSTDGSQLPGMQGKVGDAARCRCSRAETQSVHVGFDCPEQLDFHRHYLSRKPSDIRSD